MAELDLNARQVQAVGIALGHGDMTPTKVKIENAMKWALELAQTQGISDPDALRGVMLAARDRALAS